MPCYEYRCPTNDRVVEVRHRMSESLATWGELCARAGLEPGSTPDHAPVERLMSLPVPTPAAGGPAPEGCGPGCACALPSA